MIRRGDWTQRIPNRFGAIAGLTGGKLGILGLGAIGMEFVKRAPRASTSRCGYCNRNRRSDVDYAYFPNVIGWRLGRLPDRLPALGRLQQAHHQCRGAEGAGSARPSGEYQRGWAVDEAALAEALRNDVDRGRSARRVPTRSRTRARTSAAENQVMTPHFGGGTAHAQRRMTTLVRQNLDAHFAGKPVVSPLPELRDMAANPEGRLR